MLRRTLLMALLTATPVLAQETTTPAPRSNVEFARRSWVEVQDYLARSAAAAPESLFAFKPTPDVRSFGEMLDHVAASEREYCHLALGESSKESGEATGATGKRAVIAALETSKALCARAYDQSEVDAARLAFGSTRVSRLQRLLENVQHDNLHYGNIVTYLRMNRMVPPSSQPPAR